MGFAILTAVSLHSVGLHQFSGCSTNFQGDTAGTEVSRFMLHMFSGGFTADLVYFGCILAAASHYITTGRKFSRLFLSKMKPTQVGCLASPVSLEQMFLKVTSKPNYSLIVWFYGVHRELCDVHHKMGSGDAWEYHLIKTFLSGTKILILRLNKCRAKLSIWKMQHFMPKIVF